MTELRDQFAMAALTGMLAHPDEEILLHEDISRSAYKFADAMLEARSPRREPTVDNLDLSVRTANLLDRMGVKTMAELRKVTRVQYIDAGAGTKSINEISKILSSRTRKPK